MLNAKWEGDGGVGWVRIDLCDSAHLGESTETSSGPYRAGIHAYVDCPDGSWSCF